MLICQCTAINQLVDLEKVVIFQNKIVKSSDFLTLTINRISLGFRLLVGKNKLFVVGQVVYGGGFKALFRKTASAENNTVTVNQK